MSLVDPDLQIWVRGRTWRAVTRPVVNPLGSSSNSSSFGPVLRESQTEWFFANLLVFCFISLPQHPEGAFCFISLPQDHEGRSRGRNFSYSYPLILVFPHCDNDARVHLWHIVYICLKTPRFPAEIKERGGAFWFSEYWHYLLTEKMVDGGDGF